MKKFFKQFRYGEKGFTLVELLVVVAILGVLAAVAIPNVTKFIGTGNSEAAQTELANVQTAAAAWMADNVGTAPSGTMLTDTDGFLRGTTPPYLLQDTAYEYTCDADGVVTQGAKK